MMQELLHHIKQYAPLSEEAEQSLYDCFEQVVLAKQQHLLTEGKICRHLYFLENFEVIKQKIRNASGNRLLELYQDKTDPCIFFTYSYWETEQDLENYRNSELFFEIWSETKKLFNKKPEAWSVDKVVSLV